MLMRFLKKTMKIDLETEDLAIIDESRCQNTTNTARRFCNPTINGVRDPNRLIKTGERFGVNGVGFQGINCSSAIFFNQKNNANNFAITLCKYQILRIENQEAIFIMYNAINDPKLEINNIKIELLKERANEKELKKLFDDAGSINEKKFKSLCKKYNINYYKINIRLKEHLKNNLNNKKLINLMKKERKLNLIIDNARIHTAKIVEEICEILSINLVFLPPYCPFLSPIEDVWKDIKGEIYNSNYNTLNELTDLFEKKFYEKVDSISYYKNWMDKFLA